MEALRKDFISTFMQQGFGFAEGQKWKKNIDKDMWKQTKTSHKGHPTNKTCIMSHLPLTGWMMKRDIKSVNGYKIT